MNFKAISYLARLKEVFETASVWNLIVGLLVIGLIFFFAIKLFNRLVYPKSKQNKSVAALFAHMLLLPVCFIWGIKGGLQEIPIRQADVYYSKNNFLNLAVVNSAWNLGSSIEKNIYFKNSNPLLFISEQEADSLIDHLYFVLKDTTIKVLNTNTNINIVILLLENWSADCINSLRGYDSIVPNFDQLAKEGILFTNVFGSGSLSDQGISAVLSAQPALPEVIVVNQPDKFVKLPSISSDLKKNGYFTSFLFGGQLSYGNIKAYLMTKDFDEIHDISDISSTIPRGRLGIHDEFMLKLFANKLNQQKSPFFSILFTLSSHSPYDMHFGRIAMMLYGEPIKKEYSGMTISTYCSQTDLARTLFKQLNFPHSNYCLSKDLFNPYSKSFSYYVYDAGYGWVSDSNYYAYIHYDKSMLFQQLSSNEDNLKHIKYKQESFSYCFKIT